MSDDYEIEPQGDHQYVVHLHSNGEVKESWFSLDPGVLEQLGAGEADEERVVRQTVAFLLRHQEASDLPDLVELEDVIASYDDYIAAMTD